MTDPRNDITTQDETELGTSVHDALDAIEPSPEARERMLAALKEKAAEAQAEAADGAAAVGATDEAAAADGTDGADGVVAADESDAADKAAAGETSEAAPVSASAEAGSTPANVIPAPAPRKRMSRGLRIGLPIAACAVVAAICVVGISANNAFDANRAATEPAPTVETTDAADGANAATPDEVGKNASALGDSDMATEAEEAMGYMPPPAPEPDWNTEEYDSIDETGFVSTATKPLSTVSADVDTASYCNLRRMINSGFAAVPTGSVRIEEMLNYFTYDYATPTGNDDFATTVQIVPCPWNNDTQLMVLGFATATEPVATDKGSNLVFLIDVSGSMEGDDRLGLLQDSFAVLTDQLEENDVISIVTYSGQEKVVLDGASGADARDIQRAIDKLDASGSTNGEAGLKMAYELAEKHFIEGGVNRIVMASDGDLNVGMSSESDLHDFVDSKRESGIYLSVLGFGEGNYKDNKMETLADHGNGNYHYIDCIDEAEKVLGQDLMANLIPFADDVKVQVEFNPAQVKAYRLIGYENRALADEDFLDDTVDAGDVGPNTQFTVAYEVALADSALQVDVPELKYGDSGAGSAAAQLERYTSQDAYADELCTANLRYRAFADDAVHQTEAIVHRSDITDTLNDNVKFAAAVIEFAMAMRGSEYAGTSSMDTALELLDGMDLNDERAGFRDLVKKAQRNQVRASDTVDDWGNDWSDAYGVEDIDGNDLA